ncbi:MAG: RNA methyltransferase [Desulfuromonadales bacterium]|nr:RNA methyltransferase [Desulfuromonadales bacterium]
MSLPPAPTSPLTNIAVILIEPQGPLNIGSVCRVMMNFGLSDLRLVNPQTDHLGEEARRMAVRAAPLLEQARVYLSLPDALAGCSLAIGTTRRFGKYREDFIHPNDAGREILTAAASASTALVFGREDRGLHTSELDLCQRFLTIPTSDELPSMNLAQAVAVCLYEVGQAGAEAAGKVRERRRKSAPSAAIEAMYSHMRQSLLEIGYLDPQNPEHILRTFRRIFSRAGLNERDVRILQGLWSRLDWIENERRKEKEKK